MTRTITPAPIGYLTVAEAAEMAGIKLTSMYGNIRKGNLPEDAIRVINRKTFLRQRDVEDFIEWREQQPRTKASKWGLPPREMLAEFDHLASIIGPEQANNRLMKLYGLNPDTIQAMRKKQKYLQRRREARNAA